jgi:hypothetical protein
MNVESIIASNEMLGAVLTLALLAIWARNRSFAQELVVDPDPAWRAAPRLAVISAGAVILWISLFDNWRQLTALPWRATERYPSQLILIDPPSDAIRAVSFGLLGVLLVFVACLFARHVGGYLLQSMLAVGAFIAWLPFFILRQRFTFNLALGLDGSWTSPGDVASYLGFAVISWGLDIGLIAVSFAFLTGLASLPVTLMLDVLRLRRPRVTAEAQPFFNAIGGRIAR